MTSEIIDSQLPVTEALAQNPNNICPKEIHSSINLAEVRYFGFDHQVHVGQIAVAETLISEIRTFFEYAFDIKFPINKVVPAADHAYKWDDERLMAANISSGFNYRLIAGTDKPSLHGLGRAFDINPLQNPYIRYEEGNVITKPKGASWKPEAPGTLSAGHSLVELMRDLGWEWGGNWKPDSGRTDYHHFQKPYL